MDSVGAGCGKHVAIARCVEYKIGPRRAKSLSRLDDFVHYWRNFGGTVCIPNSPKCFMDWTERRSGVRMAWRNLGRILCHGDYSCVSKVGTRAHVCACGRGTNDRFNVARAFRHSCGATEPNHCGAIGRCHADYCWRDSDQILLNVFHAARRGYFSNCIPVVNRRNYRPEPTGIVSTGAFTTESTPMLSKRMTAVKDRVRMENVFPGQISTDESIR